MKEITLSRGMVAIVDDADFDWLNQWKWYARPNGKTVYAVREVDAGDKKQRLVHMHREIANTPEGMITDHADRNGLHNWRGNLRIVDDARNARNKGVASNNRSGYKGVRYHSGGYWQARITVGRKSSHIGLFRSAENAAIAYNIAALEHHGEFACLNT